MDLKQPQEGLCPVLKSIQNKETQIDGSCPCPAHWLISGNPLAAAWGSDVARILWLKHEEHQGKHKHEARAEVFNREVVCGFVTGKCESKRQEHFWSKGKLSKLHFIELICF